MGILAVVSPLVNPLHLGCVYSCGHVDPIEQLIAHFLGLLFHGDGQVLHSHWDFAGELLSCCLKPKVVFAMCISELG